MELAIIGTSGDDTLTRAEAMWQALFGPAGADLLTAARPNDLPVATDASMPAALMLNAADGPDGLMLSYGFATLIRQGLTVSGISPDWFIHPS